MIEDDAAIVLGRRNGNGNCTTGKEKNRHKVEQAEAAGRLKVLFKSNVTAIDDQQVELEQEGTRINLLNDAVIVSAGGVLPTPFLQKIGIEVETKYGTS